jgi:hypothetical protein
MLRDNRHTRDITSSESDDIHPFDPSEARSAIAYEPQQRATRSAVLEARELAGAAAISDERHAWRSLWTPRDDQPHPEPECSAGRDFTHGR